MGIQELQGQFDQAKSKPKKAQEDQKGNSRSQEKPE